MKQAKAVNSAKFSIGRLESLNHLPHQIKKHARSRRLLTERGAGITRVVGLEDCGWPEGKLLPPRMANLCVVREQWRITTYQTRSGQSG
jgi:hypothetical protein